MKDDMRAFNFNFHNLSALCPKCIETFPIGDIHIHGEINFDEHAFPNTCCVKKAACAIPKIWRSVFMRISYP